MAPLKFDPKLIPPYKADDFTWYCPYEHKPGEQVEFNRDCSSPESTELRGGQNVRFLVCSCFRRTRLSYTVRRIPPFKRGKPFPPSNNVLTISGYLDANKDRKKNLNTIDEICMVLKEAIFGAEERLPKKEGMIIVTGATNAGKSVITRGLIHKYLQARLLDDPEGRKRRPHLVTFEDPIEVYFAPPEELDSNGGFQTGIDYTPRQLDLDVKTLDAALEDALRQTPEVFYVGEVRDRGQWRKLVDFAGTGHLIITTAHAGSLREAMRNVFRALNVRTPAERSVIAERILAVVHLRSEKLPKKVSAKSGVKQMIVPTVWRHTSEGIMAIMEYGLSSVFPDQKSELGRKSCLGRAWFIKKLIDAHCQYKSQGKKRGFQALVNNFAPLVIDAAGWDLEGR